MCLSPPGLSFFACGTAAPSALSPAAAFEPPSAPPQAVRPSASAAVTAARVAVRIREVRMIGFPLLFVRDFSQVVPAVWTPLFPGPLTFRKRLTHVPQTD